MNATNVHAGNASVERLGWGEVCKRFPDAWVVVIEIDWPDDQLIDLATFVVIAHHPRRKGASPDVKAAFQHHDEVGCFWTGKIRGPFPRFVGS